MEKKVDEWLRDKRHDRRDRQKDRRTDEKTNRWMHEVLNNNLWWMKTCKKFKDGWKEVIIKKLTPRADPMQLLSLRAV